MNTFVGAEYVIANSLIALKKKGIDYITFSKLREISCISEYYLQAQQVTRTLLVGLKYT